MIVDHDSPTRAPLPIFESGAILLYLAEKTGKFLATDTAERSETVQWLTMQVANVGPAFGQCVHFTHYAPEAETAYARTRFRTMVRNLLQVIDERLAQRAFIAGAGYSIADMALLPWMQVVDFVLAGPTLVEYRNIARWAEELGQRPRVKRALGTVEELKAKITMPQDAEPAHLDRFFGRGRYSRT